MDDISLREFACDFVEDPTGRQLLEAIFSNSPFLSRCALDDIGFVRRLLTRGPEHILGQILDRLKEELAREENRERLMKELRIARRQVALLVAVADFTDHWVLDRVTESLSDFADGALSAVVSHLMIQAAARGDIAPVDEDSAEEDCGYVILAMGKHGARELNYSSDIDLIVLYDPMRVDYRGKRSLQQAAVRMTRELVAIMSERTADGYVCRVDLRLRPDPSATPVASAYSSALTYYLGRGRDWERAAMMKARPVAGDLSLGRQFLAELTPFIWRDDLDFWTIRAIQSIKQQINEQRGGGQIGFAGHNVKLGRGGIREIEFLAQTLQLIYGGRDPYVRCKKTGPDAALKRLDEFLRSLPDGVRFFSLLAANLPLLELLADIMSGAPAIVRELTRQPGLLETALTPGFFGVAPDGRLLEADCLERLSQARSLEDAMQLARRWTDEHRFQLRVNILRHAVNVHDAGLWLSDILEAMLQGLLGVARDDVSQAHGRIPGPGMAIIALGKFADRDITVCSDVDLVFVVDDMESELRSDGTQPLDGGRYFSLFAQRYLDTVKAVMGSRRVSVMDIERCMPETNEAHVHTLSTLEHCCRITGALQQRTMLARARVVAAPPVLEQRVTKLFRAIRKEELDSRTVMVDMAEQHTQLEREHSVADTWNLEYRHGGLAELRLLAQYLQLRHSTICPEVLDRVPRDVLDTLSEAGLIDGALARRLMTSDQLLRELQNYLHATAGDSLNEELMPDGLKLSLARAGGQPDFETTKKLVENATRCVRETFVEIIDTPVRMERE